MRPTLVGLFILLSFLVLGIAIIGASKLLEESKYSSEYSITCLHDSTVIYEGEVSGLKTNGSFFFFNDIELDLRIITNSTCLMATPVN